MIANKKIVIGSFSLIDGLVINLTADFLSLFLTVFFPETRMKQ